MQKKLILILFFFMAGLLSAQDYTDLPNRYLAERLLGGLKVKLADNFTVGGWGAIYLGDQYFPERALHNNWRYQGFDVVPGFEFGVGKLFNKVNFSLGGDFYYFYRQFSWNDEPDFKHVRSRGNIIFSMPFAKSFSLQVIQRFERMVQTQKLLGITKTDQTEVHLRYRTLMKVTAPKFTSWKIAPFIGFEQFKHPVDAYLYELEYGFAVSPIKQVSVSASHMIISQPEWANYEIHQICVNVNCLIDVSKQIERMVAPAKPGN